jgi:hypothetical protein
MQSTFITVVEELGYQRTEKSGVPERDIAAWEKKSGVDLPEGLREYLLAVGNMAFNRAYNKLYTLDELRIEGDKLIFMEEIENVVQWAIDIGDLSDDPLVFQRASGEGDELWYPEEEACTSFLTLMIYWQTVNGGFEFFALGDAREPVIGKIAKEWARKGVVLCVVEGDVDYNVMLAARDDELLEQAMMELQGVGVGAFSVQ